MKPSKALCQALLLGLSLDPDNQLHILLVATTLKNLSASLKSELVEALIDSMSQPALCGSCFCSGVPIGQCTHLV